MKTAFALSALVATVLAYPKMEEFENEMFRRQNQGGGGLWGDLDSEGATTETGKAILGVFKGSESALSSASYEAPDMDSSECADDPCCVWKYMGEEMLSQMKGGNGCNDFARASIRLGFHDSGAWEIASGEGGADASIMSELGRDENSGLAPHAQRVKGLHSKYSSVAKISLADSIQLAAKVGVMACKGPRIRFFSGRKDSSSPGPEGLLPSPIMAASASMDLFAAKGISPRELVALLGAHTCSQAHGNGPASPQDKTPGVWDTEYFSELLRTSQSGGVTRFLADNSLAMNEMTRPMFEDFAKNLGSWDAAYASAYVKMSLFGVMKMNSMTECSKAMPGGTVEDDDSTSSSSTKTSTSTSMSGTSTKETETSTSESSAAEETYTSVDKPKSTYKVTETSYTDSPASPAETAPPSDETAVAPVSDSAATGRFAASLVLVGAAFALL